MHDHKKKIAGAVISAGVVIAYYVIFFSVIMTVVESMIARLLLGIGPAVLVIALIAVLAQRIKEIKGGEEDDLSKY